MCKKTKTSQYPDYKVKYIEHLLSLVCIYDTKLVELREDLCIMDLLYM